MCKPQVKTEKAIYKAIENIGLTKSWYVSWQMWQASTVQEKFSKSLQLYIENLDNTSNLQLVSLSTYIHPLKEIEFASVQSY